MVRHLFWIQHLKFLPDPLQNIPIYQLLLYTRLPILALQLLDILLLATIEAYKHERHPSPWQSQSTLPTIDRGAGRCPPNEPSW